MSKTIRVIDLLNKIANGEEVPEKIKWDKEEYEYKEKIKDYLNECECSLIYIMTSGHMGLDILDYEVEIIEEQQEIDIQNIEDIKDVFIENSTCGEDVKYLARKYNEILKWAKQVDKKIKEK